MQYTVVHSTDPYLLARLATDLQMNRYNIFSLCGDFQNPFDVSRNTSDSVWMAINDPLEEGDFSITFHNHKCIEPETRHELTSRNYIKVLTQILEP